jgi:hypothetical protein
LFEAEIVCGGAAMVKVDGADLLLSKSIDSKIV